MPSTSHLVSRSATAARITLTALVVTAFWFLTVMFISPGTLDHLERVMALYTFIVTIAATAACTLLVLIKDQKDEHVTALTQQLADLAVNLKNEGELADAYAAMAKKLDDGRLRKEFFTLHPDGSHAAFMRWVEEWVKENVGSQYADICAEAIAGDE